MYFTNIQLPPDILNNRQVIYYSHLSVMFTSVKDQDILSIILVVSK